MFLILALVMSGRIIRHHLLVGPEGVWKEHLWLDELIAENALAVPAEKPPRPQLTGPLPINTCSLDSLTLLPGVGPVLAERIDDVRRAGIVFHSPEDLETVKGIGPALSGRLGPLVDYSIPEGTSALCDTCGARDQIPANSR